MLEGFCFPDFSAFFSHGQTLHVSTQGNNKTNEGKHREKHRWNHAVCAHVKKRQKKSREAESFKHMKIKYATHLKMAM
jgi:hypothetical protein